MKELRRVLFIQKIAGVAGSEKYFLDIMPELKKKGWEAEFLMIRSPNDLSGSNQFYSLLKERQITIHTITSVSILSFSLLKQISQIIKKGNYDLVQTNLIHADIWGGLVKTFFMSKLKLVSVKHGYSEEFQSKHGFDVTKLKKDVFYWCTKMAALKANKILAISSGLYRLLVNGIGIPEHKLALVPLGIPLTTDTENERAPIYRYSTPQLLIVGRLVPVKQQHLVIELLPVLRKWYPKIVLILIGDGSSRPEIEALIKKLNVEDHVKLLGFRQEVSQYIEASDLILVPSAAEGFGLVVLEGWRMKKAVIAFDVPAPNEIIENGKDGYLIKPFDIEELLIRIKELLEDQSKAQAMGELGFQKLQQQYALEVMVNKTLKAYEEVL